MDKYITDERTGLKYELVGDYYLIASDGILQPLVGIHQAFHAEHEEVRVGDIGVSIEILGFRTYAHGMNTEAHLLQGLFRVEVFLLRVIAAELLLAQAVEIFHDRKIRRPLWCFMSIPSKASTARIAWKMA